MTYVDWNHASAYAAWVGGRLPTEAEWEYACRGGDGRIYPWGDEPPATERLNYNGEIGGTTEVGTYPPGANDLYDMAGNVYEWTADWYSEDYYKNSTERNPVGPDEGGTRSLRGRSWVIMMSTLSAARSGGTSAILTTGSGTSRFLSIGVPRLSHGLILWRLRALDSVGNSAFLCPLCGGGLGGQLPLTSIPP